MKETNVSVFKDLFKTRDVPYIVHIEKVLQRIKVGKSKHLIEQIRQGKSDLKKKLPSIVFSGEFTERNSKGLVKHSGLMVLDFDKYPSKEILNKNLEILKTNKHFLSLFISPSGNGIKGVVRVTNNLTKETHSKVFKSFVKEYNYEYLDISGSDINRVCFESYDPNIYINYDAEVYSCEIIDEGFLMKEKVPLIPISSEDDIVEKIMKFGWKKDFVEGERNNFIFDLAGAFCEYGISLSYAEGYILNNVVYGNFSERETITTIKSAYKKRDFDSKYFEDYKKVNAIKQDLKYGKNEVIKKHHIDEETYNSVKEEKEVENFWFINKKGEIKIDALKYKHFLESKGFKKYFPNDTQKPTWVKIESSRVKETSIEKIKDFVLTYLLNNEEFDAWKLCVNYANIFSENYLLMLDSIELVLLKDTKEKSYIAYQNGILEVSKKEVNLIEYVDYEGYVWESQIIQRDFILSDDNSNDYKSFINNISSNEPLAIECVIGYLLSTYKNKMNNKAIILNDEIISENPEGGTGKGVLIQGIKQIRKVAILDGKTFDDKKSFPYQTVSQDSQVVVFDDVKKNFSFESKFSLVTEGITLERKGKDAIKLTVEESPKMVISTNYAIKGTGNSHDRRRHEIEISQYYGREITPYSEFGRQMFDDWSNDDFIKFDNYMVYCIQTYLKQSLVKQNAKNLKMRKFIIETSFEFLQWIEEEGNYNFNARVPKKEAFDAFVAEYDDYKKWLKRKTFNSWMQKYAIFKDYHFKDINTNGVRYFEVIKKGEVLKEEEEIIF